MFVCVDWSLYFKVDTVAVGKKAVDLEVVNRAPAQKVK